MINVAIKFKFSMHYCLCFCAKLLGEKTLLESILVGQFGQPLTRLETLENVES